MEFRMVDDKPTIGKKNNMTTKNFSLIKLAFFIIAIVLFASCTTQKDATKNDLPWALPDRSDYDSTVFEPIYDKLKSGDPLSKSEIEGFASNVATRADFYFLLVEFHKETLFPTEYYSFEKAAESILTNWLLYPTELDTIPSEIEVVKKVSFLENDTTFQYYVLQFRTDEPHWAASDGWLIGVVGPYFEDSSPYDWTAGTFSKFSKVKETTPEKEVEWIHENVFRKSPE
jgi:hypothetical protein